MQLRARACARTKAPLFKVTQHLSGVRWRDLLRKPRWCVHCRRKAVITMLNERFVALYSDDISPVTGCNGLANIFRSRPRRIWRDASGAFENCQSSGALQIAAYLLLNHVITSTCCYANYLQLRRWITERIYIYSDEDVLFCRLFRKNNFLRGYKYLEDV